MKSDLPSKHLPTQIIQRNNRKSFFKYIQSHQDRIPDIGISVLTLVGIGI